MENKIIPFEKGVLITSDGEKLLVGFSNDEIKDIRENPAAFDTWLDIYGKKIE